VALDQRRFPCTAPPTALTVTTSPSALTHGGVRGRRPSPTPSAMLPASMAPSAAPPPRSVPDGAVPRRHRNATRLTTSWTGAMAARPPRSDTNVTANLVVHGQLRAQRHPVEVQVMPDSLAALPGRHSPAERAFSVRNGWKHDLLHHHREHSCSASTRTTGSSSGEWMSSPYPSPRARWPWRLRGDSPSLSGTSVKTVHVALNVYDALLIRQLRLGAIAPGTRSRSPC